MTHRTPIRAGRTTPGSGTDCLAGRKFRLRLNSSTAFVFLTLLALLISNASTTGAQENADRPVTTGAQENTNRPAQPVNTQTTTPAITTTTTTTQTPVVEPAATPKPVEPVVTDVYNIKSQDGADAAERAVAGLGDIIIVRVTGLRELLHRAKCTSEDPQNPPPATCRPQELLLYLDGRPLKGLLPESGAPKPEEGTLRFHLQRPGEAAPAEDAADTDEHWADLLGLSTDDIKLYRTISVSVGLENEYPIDTQVKDFRLLRMRRGRLIFWSIFFALCLIALVHFARASDLLRDRKPVIWKQRKPYSLSLTQAAWWFVLTVISFVFIWMVTGQYDLSTSVLVLLGIGFGTALGSVVIDQNKGARPATPGSPYTANELDTLLAQKNEQEARLTALEANLRDARTGLPDAAAQAALFAQQSAYDRLITEIKQKYPGSIGGGHINFPTDILSDAHGVSFHRFQMLIWTVVLGFIFIHSVFTRLAMPQFSTTLLTLMGISAGAYLGGKGAESNDTEVTTTQPTPPSGGGSGGNSDVDTPGAMTGTTTGMTTGTTTGANVPPPVVPAPPGDAATGDATASDDATPVAENDDADDTAATGADNAPPDDTGTAGSGTRT